MAEPIIALASFNGIKTLVISGRGFGDHPRVLINEVDCTPLIKESSDTIIKLKGRAGKLGLVAGENTAQVIGENGSASAKAFIRVSTGGYHSDIQE